MALAIAALPRSFSERGALRRIRGSLNRLVEKLVHRGIDAADEKARYAGHAPDRLTRGNAVFKAGEKRLHHLLVDLLREQERDVDVDAFGEKLADRRYPGGGGGDLDEDVLAADRLPKTPRLLDRCRGIHGEIGRHFEADEAVAALGFLVERAQHVGGGGNIRGGDPFIDRAERGLALADEPRDVGIVGRALADRLLEDRRIGGDAGEAILLDQPFKLAIRR